MQSYAGHQTHPKRVVLGSERNEKITRETATVACLSRWAYIKRSLKLFLSFSPFNQNSAIRKEKKIKEEKKKKEAEYEK